LMNNHPPLNPLPSRAGKNVLGNGPFRLDSMLKSRDRERKPFDNRGRSVMIIFMAEEFRMSDANRETIRQFILAMIHREADFDPKPDLEKVVNLYDEMISTLPTLLRGSMNVLIKTLELSTIAQGYRHTFSHLSPEQQKQYLYKMENSSNYAFRGVMLGVKTMALLVYFSEPEAEKAVGYDGKCLVEARLEQAAKTAGRPAVERTSR